MLVIILEDQLLPTQQICQACLMANQSGQPRWQQGQLRCGRALSKPSADQPDQYECQMGFRVANIE